MSDGNIEQKPDLKLVGGASQDEPIQDNLSGATFGGAQVDQAPKVEPGLDSLRVPQAQPLVTRGEELTQAVADFFNGIQSSAARDLSRVVPDELRLGAEQGQVVAKLAHQRVAELLKTKSPDVRQTYAAWKETQSDYGDDPYATAEVAGKIRPARGERLEEIRNGGRAVIASLAMGGGTVDPERAREIADQLLAAA